MKKRNDFVWYFLVAPDDVGEGMEESLGCSATVSGLEIIRFGCGCGPFLSRMKEEKMAWPLGLISELLNSF
jgi:hypothetical protein